MNYKGLEMPELIACEPQIHKDNRGFVFELFKKVSMMFHLPLIIIQNFTKKGLFCY